MEKGGGFIILKDRAKHDLTASCVKDLFENILQHLGCEEAAASSIWMHDLSLYVCVWVRAVCVSDLYGADYWAFLPPRLTLNSC